MLKENSKGWIYVTAQFIIIFLILFFCYQDRGNIGDKSSIINIVGIIIAISGFILAIFTLITFSQPMTPNPVPLRDSKLRTIGPYKYIRHPMYSSVLLSLLGVVLYVKSLYGLFCWIAAIVFIIFKIKFEEKNLNERFSEYSEYTRNTKKLIPFIY